jgi:anti-anti-sigma factor
MHFVHAKPRSRGATATFTRTPEGGSAVVLEGELDHDGVIDVENDVRWAVTQAVESVSVDCSGITFVDSAGLRLLIQAQMMAVDRHLRFVLVHPSSNVVRLLEMTGLTDHIQVDWA